MRNLKIWIRSLLLSAVVLSANAATILTLSPAGISGNAGTTTGWGFTLTNDTNYLVVSSASYCKGPVSLPVCNASGVGTFSDIISSINLTVVGPAPEVSPLHEDFVLGVSGVGSFAIDPGATPGTVEPGQIVLTYDLYSVSPNDPQFDSIADLVSRGNTLTANTDITITAVPEPATIALSGLAILALCGLRRRGTRQS